MANTSNLLFFLNDIPRTMIWPFAFAFVAKPYGLKLFLLPNKLNSCFRLRGRKRRSRDIESSRGRSSGGSRRGSRSTSQTEREKNKQTVVSLRVMCSVVPLCLYYPQPALVCRHRGLKDGGGEQTHRSSALSFTHKALPVSSLSMTNAEDFHDQQDGSDTWDVAEF